MPRSVDLSIESSASVEQIHQAFCTEDYWLARLEAFGGIGRLDSLIVDAEGAVTVVVVHDLGRDGLPGLVAKFYPRDWRVVQTETWSPLDEGAVRGEINQQAHGTPGSGFATVVVAPANDGSCLTGSATVEVRVPLVGGKVEGMVCRQLAEQIAVIQRFTADWIAENG
jgi:hypothetical protein